MWNEALVSYFEDLYQHLNGGTEENYDNFTQKSRTVVVDIFDSPHIKLIGITWQWLTGFTKQYRSHDCTIRAVDLIGWSAQNVDTKECHSLKHVKPRYVTRISRLHEVITVLSLTKLTNTLPRQHLFTPSNFGNILKHVSETNFQTTCN